jgi:hypothetical protein
MTLAVAKATHCWKPNLRHFYSTRVTYDHQLQSQYVNSIGHRFVCHLHFNILLCFNYVKTVDL